MEKLKYIIISNKKNKSIEEILLLQSAYTLWKSIWSPILKETFTADAFSSQSFYCLLVCGETVVAMTLNSIFDARLESTFDHSYFQHFPKSYYDQLKKLNPRYITTYESLTVREDYRKKDIGILMIQLGMMFSKYVGASLLLCPAMRINGVNNLCKGSGFEVLLESIDYKGHLIDLLFFRPAENIITSSVLFYSLWEERVDFSNVTMGLAEEDQKFSLAS